MQKLALSFLDLISSKSLIARTHSHLDRTASKKPLLLDKYSVVWYGNRRMKEVT